jgi:hypothetical protein
MQNTPHSVTTHKRAYQLAVRTPAAALPPIKLFTPQAVRHACLLSMPNTSCSPPVNRPLTLAIMCQSTLHSVIPTANIRIHPEAIQPICNQPCARTAAGTTPWTRPLSATCCLEPTAHHVISAWPAQSDTARCVWVQHNNHHQETDTLQARINHSTCKHTGSKA